MSTTRIGYGTRRNATTGPTAVQLFFTAFEAYIRNEVNYWTDSLCYVSGNAPPWSGECNAVVTLENGFAKTRTCT